MSVNVWTIGFPGCTPEQTRTARLALLRLLEPVADTDPLRSNVAGMLARDLPCSRLTAVRTLEVLRRWGWINAADAVAGTVGRRVPVADVVAAILERGEYACGGFEADAAGFVALEFGGES